MQDNICYKAYALIKQNFPSIPPVQVHLHKVIPMGAGLGGGSADGAFMLRLLNEKYHLQLTDNELIHYASILGSDCAFFIKNTSCYGTGRGEVLEEIVLSMKGYSIVLVNPKIHINTGWAFSQITPKASDKDLRELVQRPIAEWQNNLINDFENPVMKHHPEIARIKQQLLEAGALYASMSGSGSTVYGIFDKKNIDIPFPSHYFCTETQVL